MKTAQEIYSILKKEHNPLVALQSSEWYDHYQLACVKAYEHTFGKGYNPEVMEDLWRMLRGVSTLDWLLSAEYIAAIKSILEKAKLK